MPFRVPSAFGGFIPAFARCCFCIAASLLVFTSPMTSSLAFLRHCYCVNVTGSVVPTEDYSVGITTRKHFAHLPPFKVTTSAVHSGTKCRNAAANSRWHRPRWCCRNPKRGSTCRSHCRCRTATQRAAANCTRNGPCNRRAASGNANARTNDSSDCSTDSRTNGPDCREGTRRSRGSSKRRSCTSRNSSTSSDSCANRQFVFNFFHFCFLHFALFVLL